MSSFFGVSYDLFSFNWLLQNGVQFGPLGSDCVLSMVTRPLLKSQWSFFKKRKIGLLYSGSEIVYLRKVKENNLLTSSEWEKQQKTVTFGIASLTALKLCSYLESLKPLISKNTSWPSSEKNEHMIIISLTLLSLSHSHLVLWDQNYLYQTLLLPVGFKRVGHEVFY